MSTRCKVFSRFQFSRKKEVIPGLVISDKGPVEDGNRSCKHTLHWAGSHALSSGWPEHSHWVGAADITIDNWWLHTARSVRLHPPIYCEGKTRQLLSEVLNHIVPLHKWKCRVRNLSLQILTFIKFAINSPQALREREHQCQVLLGALQPCWSPPWWPWHTLPRKSYEK